MSNYPPVVYVPTVEDPDPNDPADYVGVPVDDFAPRLRAALGMTE